MICPKCQSEIPGQSRYCLKCGSQVSEESGQEGRPESARPGAVASQTISPLPTLAAPMGAAEHADVRSVPLDSRYALLQEIGHGGYGTVFKARDKRLDRIVAVKRLHARKPERQASGQAEQRFLRESQLIASLNHRNIVQVFDTDKDAEGFYIVMEYVEGGSLRDLIRERQKLPVKEALTMARGIAQGLAYAHRRKLVHRDIKPGNILLARNDEGIEPKIVDFGLARAGGESDLSISGYGMGTPFYMPPEQHQSAKSVNHTADIYALGKLIYEMITGEVPDNVLPHRIPPVPGLSALIFKCIESRPEERFFSMDDLIRAIDSFSGGGASVAKASSLMPGLVTVAGYCPVCGTDNEEAARFCVGCGQGLFRKCPECSREMRTSLRFCSACGNDMDGFEKLRATLQNMREYSQGRRWSRVIKETGLLQEMPRLTGETGRQMLEEFQALRQEATTRLKELKEIDSQITLALADHRLEEALRLANQCQGLDPSNPELAARAAEIMTRIDNRDYANAHLSAIQKLQARDVAAARQVFSRYLHEHAHGSHVQEATAWIGQHLPVLECYLGVIDADAWLCQAFEARRYTEAEAAATRQIETIAGLAATDALPEHADEIVGDEQLATAAQFAERAREILQRITDDRKTARALIEEARQLETLGGYEEAISRVQQAANTYPRTEEEQQLLANLEAGLAVQRQHISLFVDYVADARGAFQAHRLMQCRRVLDHARLIRSQVRIHDSSQDYETWRETCRSADELEPNVVAAEHQFLETLETIKATLRGDRAFVQALEQCTRAETTCTDSRELEQLKREAAANLEKLETLLHATREAMAARQWTLAVQQAEAAFLLAPSNETVREIKQAAGQRRSESIRRQRRIALYTAAGVVSAAVLASLSRSAWHGFCSNRFHYWQDQDGTRACYYARRLPAKYAEAKEYLHVASEARTSQQRADEARKTINARVAAAVDPEILDAAQQVYRTAEQEERKGHFKDAKDAWQRARNAYVNARRDAEEIEQRAAEARIPLQETRDLASEKRKLLPDLLRWEPGRNHANAVCPNCSSLTNAARLAEATWAAAERTVGEADRHSSTGAYYLAWVARTNAAALYSAFAEGVTRWHGLHRSVVRFEEHLLTYSNLLAGEEIDVEALFRESNATQWSNVLELRRDAEEALDPFSATFLLDRAFHALTNDFASVRLDFVLTKADQLMASNRVVDALHFLAAQSSDLRDHPALRERRDAIGAKACHEALMKIRLRLEPTSFNQATNLLRLAGRLGYAPAQFFIRRYSNENLYGFRATDAGGLSDAESQERDLKRLDAERKDPIAGFALATSFRSRPAEQPRAKTYYQAAAEAGFPPAMVYCGDMLLRQVGPDERASRAAASDAARWFEKAALTNDTGGMVEHGRRLLLAAGEDEPRIREAVKWFERAAVAGDPAGYCEMALECWKKREVFPEIADEEKVKWLHIAAAAEDVVAMITLGRVFRRGLLNVTVDPAEARRWLERAKAGGHPEAVTELDLLLAEKVGVEVE